jgi:hypothetical protein
MYYSTTKNWAQKTKKNKKSLPRAWPQALGKDYFFKKNWSENWVKKNIAEGLTADPRQSLMGVAAVT